MSEFVTGAKVMRKSASKWPNSYGFEGVEYTLAKKQSGNAWETVEGIRVSEAFFRVVSPPAPTGPVVTETVKRIVPGVYGRVKIGGKVFSDGDQISVGFINSRGIGSEQQHLSAPELRAAAAVLTQLADALEDAK